MANHFLRRTNSRDREAFACPICGELLHANPYALDYTAMQDRETFAHCPCCNKPLRVSFDLVAANFRAVGE